MGRKKKMIVENGNTVAVHYKGTLEDGTEFDNSHERGEAISFEVGSGKMIPGFDMGVIGMTIGETKNVSLTAAQAYGERLPEAVQEVPKSQFPEGFEFVEDATVHGQGPSGPIMARIVEEQEETVILDFNHPLAGKNLNFEIEMVEIES